MSASGDYIRLVLQAHLEDADTDKAERRKR
jgi:hypothetical protein